MKHTPKLKPWMKTPLELLRHAESHRLGDTDFDRRIALVGFDNAIEASVTTYLSLNPVQRGGKQYAKDDVNKWKTNFHTLIEFLESFAAQQSIGMPIDRDEFIFFHGLRNDLYHSGNGFVPQLEHVASIRDAAVWTFSTLFGIDPKPEIASSSTSLPSDGNEQKGTASAETQFLQVAIDVKKEINELLAIQGDKVPVQDIHDGLQKLDLPDDLDFSFSRFDAALREAEDLKNQIVQGPSNMGSNEENIVALTTQLISLSDHLRQRLRQYHVSAVEAAIAATVRAMHGNRIAGTVVQASGSGLSLSLEAYLEACADEPTLKGLTQLVILDRGELADQLAHRLEHAMTRSKRAHEFLFPETKEELVSALLDNHRRTIVTTMQRLWSCQPQTVLKGCIVSTLHVRSKIERLMHTFPNGIFIHFSSTLPSIKANEPNFFGDVIFSYRVSDAISDGTLLPVDIISITECEQLSDHIVARVEKTVSLLWSDYVLHGQDKAIVVTENRALMATYASAISSKLHEDSSIPRAKLPEVLALDGERDPITFHDFRHDTGPHILVVTKHRLISGMDLGSVASRCYVTCTLNNQQIDLLIPMMGHIAPGKGKGTIIDLASNRSILDGLKGTSNSPSQA